MYLGTSHGALSGTIRRKCGTMTSPALLGFLTCRLRANRDLAAPGGTSVYPRRILRPARASVARTRISRQASPGDLTAAEAYGLPSA